MLIAVLLLGLADSIVGPYLVLFGADAAHLSPWQIGVLSSVTALSGIAVSMWLARRYDRRPSRRPAVVAVSAPAAGYLLLTTTTSYALLLVIAVTLLGAGLAAFPQLFALAKSRQSDSGGAGPPEGRRRAAGTPVLRSVWSLAWAIGPLIGAVTLSRFGFTGLFVATAVLFAAVVVPLARIGPVPSAPTGDLGGGAGDARPPRRVMALLVAGGTLFHTAILAGSVVLPLFVTRTLRQPQGDVGLLFSVCAVVEIPAALALMWLPARARKELFIVGGMALLAVYFGLVTGTSSNGVMIGAQVARGVAMAVVGALGISYFQDLMPHATGRATTLFANTLTAGSLISGVLAGTAAQFLGYRATQGLCGAVALLGAVCVVLAATWARNEPGLRPHQASAHAPADARP